MITQRNQQPTGKKKCFAYHQTDECKYLSNLDTERMIM
jgi:hypothetical protein